jgi:hypothetical protein
LLIVSTAISAKNVAVAYGSHNVRGNKRVNKRVQKKRSHIGDRNMHERQDMAHGFLAKGALRIPRWRPWWSISPRVPRPRTRLRGTAHRTFEIRALAGCHSDINAQAAKSFRRLLLWGLLFAVVG